jgi:hypothetical protein
MAVVVLARYRNLTPEKYDELVSGLDLDANPPAGAILHVAGDGADEVIVTELWRTEQTFRAFYDYRLRPALLMHGVEGEPSLEIVPLHNLFAVDMEMVERIGAVSLPAHFSGAALRRAPHRTSTCRRAAARPSAVDEEDLVVARRVVALDEDLVDLELERPRAAVGQDPVRIRLRRHGLLVRVENRLREGRFVAWPPVLRAAGIAARKRGALELRHRPPPLGSGSYGRGRRK